MNTLNINNHPSIHEINVINLQPGKHQIINLIYPSLSPPSPLKIIQWIGSNFVSHIFKFGGNYRDYRL